MEAFRISIEKHSNVLTTSGRENRWNKSGEMVLYFGSSRSLSTLEMIVHRSSIKPTENYKVMIVSIADNDKLTQQIQLSDLPLNWRTLDAYSILQEIGSEWYNSKRTLILKVPSAIIVNEYNYVVNVEHPDFKNYISLVRVEDYFWDDRLFKDMN